ncbi:GGDEF domain-containing protein [Extibacter muris]|uniref:GGDEF domain-containing protein n=2 Tax=Extibacter muris TaxID=1796622 RepID=A0A4V2WSD1_9FIRM|nr:GGDEF domain-containing protein [Extibacter muris]
MTGPVERGMHMEHNKSFGACLFIDVDNFKGVNNTYGHDEGDRILINVGRIFMQNTRDRDIVIRFGGDEFVIWMYKVDSIKAAEDTAKRILKTSYDEAGTGLSIGIAMVEPGEKYYDAVIKRADEARYQAKAEGKGRYAVHRDAAEE